MKDLAESIAFNTQPATGNMNVSILSISSRILYEGFNTGCYMFVQCLCLYIYGWRGKG